MQHKYFIPRHETNEGARAGTSLKGRVVCEVIAKDIIQGEPVHLAISGKERVHTTSGKKKCVVFDDFVVVVEGLMIAALQ